ncbi:receptor-like cytoplasmic kinase 176 [Punica granatum]|uniref:Receptor-like cytoplasmic kinase 176 n=1 Tax=Punica granatum TaxID=22663 RepID=A0A6P8CC13_PUNGR|nr:receptor-like cytoplasmic kinase 176 [Punica granatum]
MDSAGSGVLRTYTKTFLDEKTEAGNIVGVGGTSKAEKKNFMDLAENPHIVKLRGYAEEGPYMALVFDYLPRTLTNGIMDLSWLDVKKIMKQLAQGMKYIHDKGYANNAKIIDLGAVKKLGPGKKSIWAQSITVEYLPPEAQRGECTTRSDIFSFGTSILQLLAKKEKPGGPRKGDGRSGKTKKKNDEEDHISVEVMRQYGRERHVLHPRLFGEARKNAAEKISNLALKCTKLADGYKSMDEIIGDVDEI